MSALLEGLNAAQRAAVMHGEGPALVLAGAGSGKTRTVVQRIAYLIGERGIDPRQLLAVTFTNKAAQEMQARIEALVGAAAKELWMGTFHAVALRILRSYGELIGLERGFVIYDEDDQLELLKEVIGTLQGLDEVNPRLVRTLIDRAKCQLWSPQALAHEGARHFGTRISGIKLELLVELYTRYEMRLRQANAVDFNDILGRTVELFGSYPEVLAQVHKRAQFIFVDEYQDTNHAQYQLTQLLAGAQRNLMVVGDPDQSIYAFRGADIRNILDFQRDYPDAAVYRLELNYRSVGSVLALANAVISQNAERLDKALRPVKGAGEMVKIYRAGDQRGEAEFVARQIASLMAERQLAYSDVAVLYRTNAQSRVLEEALRRAGIPSKIVGGVGFYERREVKDILAYAKAALNPADDVSLRRILNRPRRGIGKTSEAQLAQHAAAQRQPFIAALQQADKLLAGTAAAGRVAEFVALLDELSEAAQRLSATQFLTLVIDASGYRQMLKAEASFEAQARLENLDELLNAVAEWEAEAGGGIAAFLDEAALLASVDDRAIKAANAELPEDAVTLMTLHNAKGLEFPIVFLVGLEEQLIPHRSALGSLQEIEEERRLLYVGITRAQELLYLVHCESRMHFGRVELARPSRFLEELPKGMLEELDGLGRRLNASSASKYARAWQPAPGSPRFKGGEKVRHPRFGEGTVVGVSGQGANAELTVVFKEAGAKRLLAKYANLTPM